MACIKAGDEVRLFQRPRRRPGRAVPAGGWRGTVTRTGKRYATAEFEQTWTEPGSGQHSGTVTLSFDMETGFVRGDTEGLYVRTPEQIDQEQRRKEALYWLDVAGFEPKLGRAHFLTVDQIEQLAAVVKSWDQEG